MQKNLHYHYLTLEQRETLEKLIRSRIGAQRIAVHSECNRVVEEHRLALVAVACLRDHLVIGLVYGIGAVRAPVPQVEEVARLALRGEAIFGHDRGPII